MKTLLVCMAWLLVAVCEIRGAATYYVAPNGSDSGSGTLASPFATLEKARDTLRAIAPVSGGATVYLRGGTYYRTTALSLTSQDSGISQAYPVVWSSYPGETATLIGGLPLSNWQVYSGNIMTVNLSAQGFSGTINKLVCDGVLQRKARWPNWTDAQPYDTAFNLAVGAGSPSVFSYNAGDLPRAWANPTEGEVVIFSGGQYNSSICRIASINTSTRTISLQSPAQYPIVSGNKYYVRGLREELDAPGEWYLSPSLVLYFYPSNSISSSTITAPVTDNLFSLSAGANNITISGLNLSCCTLQAVKMTSTTNSIVTGCTIKNVGDYNTDGVLISGGYNNGASSNIISYVGRSGVGLTGGAQATLIPSANYATYNYIHHMGIECKDGSGVDLGVNNSAGGVGMYVAHNQIWSGPRSGINFLKVNNCVMEYNHIYNVMQETDDGAAIYSQNGVDWISARGCTIRYNYIHDCSGYGWNVAAGTYGPPYLCHGIFLDGITCGVDIYRNVILRTPGSGIYINGGRDNWVRNNILVDTALTTVNNEGQYLMDAHNTSSPVWYNNLANMTACYNSLNPTAWAGMRGYPYPSPSTVNTYSDTCGGNHFETNIFSYVNSPSPIYAKSYGYGGSLNNVHSNSFNGNVVWGGTSRSGYGGIVYDTYDSLYTLSAVQTQLGVELNSIQGVDPQFYGAATNNYYVYNPAALATGFQQIDMSTVGPTNLFGVGGTQTGGGGTEPPPSGGGGTAYVTATALGSVYNNNSGFMGMKIGVGASPITVTDLGRMFVSGNSGTHLLKLVDASTGLDVPGGSVSLSMSGGTAGQFKYATLSSPVVLAAGGQYYVVSQETYGGDYWYDSTTTVTTTSVATEQSWVYSSGKSWIASGTAGHAFVPVDFHYSQGGTVPPGSTTYVTGTALGSLYNDNSGFMGMKIGVGASPITVTDLGRMFVSGNSGTHLLKLVDASTGLDVPGSSVSLSMSGGTPGQFKYATLSSPVVLAAGRQYYVVSQETYGGDYWYDSGTTVTTTSVATEQSWVYSSGTSWIASGTAGHAFVPVDFHYSQGGTVPPGSTTYVTGTALGSVYNDNSGFMGMKIGVGASPITVADLGRMFVSGNSGTHLLKLVDASTGLDVPGGSVSLSMSGGTAGQFKYATLSSPVVLAAGGQYYVVSQETYGGDYWYDSGTTVTTTSVATEQSWVYSSGTSWIASGTAGHAFVPVDFHYSQGGTVPPGSTTYVTGTVLGSGLYNNNSGFTGMKIGVGASPITVTDLGRMFVSGNSGTHLLKLVDASTGLDVPGGSVSLSMSGGSPGQFKYATLSSPVVLTAGRQYYVVSQETYGGDYWYDSTTTVTTTSVATEQSWVYSSGTSWIASGTAGHAFGPVDFKY